MPVAHPQINEVCEGKIICVRCLMWKEAKEFAPARRMKRGRHSWCRLCHSLREQEKSLDPQFREARNRRRRESGVDRSARLRRLAADPEAERWASILYKYGVTREQYEARWASQGGICANPRCDRPASHLDHDHQCCPSNRKGCGECVRGFLCKGCNWALGHLGDDVDRLSGLIEYLSQQS